MLYRYGFFIRAVWSYQRYSGGLQGLESLTRVALTIRRPTPFDTEHSVPHRKLSVRGNEKKQIPIPRLQTSASEQHHDLASFLDYATRTDLNPSTNIYKGTHYEYLVAESLSQFDFNLQRIGRSNDYGIDLIGNWSIPCASSRRKGATYATQNIPVIVQCKATKPQPAMVREVEGTYIGAPAGWNGNNVLALLVTSGPATKGVREAVQRTRRPVGMLQITLQGRVQQFLWNAAAAQMGLEGLGVVVTHTSTEAPKPGLKASNAAAGDSGLALTWMGSLWRNDRRS